MSDDLTRLTDEEREALDAEGGRWNRDSMYLCVESILAARTAALIARAERAERERDEAKRHALSAMNARDEQRRMKEGNIRALDHACSELAALRAAVAGLADEWDEQRSHYPTATDARAVGAEAAVKLCAQELRALLVEGDSHAAR